MSSKGPLSGCPDAPAPPSRKAVASLVRGLGFHSFSALQFEASMKAAAAAFVLSAVACCTSVHLLLWMTFLSTTQTYSSGQCLGSSLEHMVWEGRGARLPVMCAGVVGFREPLGFQSTWPSTPVLLTILFQKNIFIVHIPRTVQPALCIQHPLSVGSTNCESKILGKKVCRKLPKGETWIYLVSLPHASNYITFTLYLQFT